MRAHPTPGDLVELHFGELPAAPRETVSDHARACARCRAFLAELESAEALLAPGPWEAPPADGLERVLARVDTARPARAARAPRVRAVLPSAAAVLVGSLLLLQGGVLAALAFFAVGSLVTLSAAPVLILEAQRSSR